jgi:hypothetical protein
MRVLVWACVRPRVSVIGAILRVSVFVSVSVHVRARACFWAEARKRA